MISLVPLEMSHIRHLSDPETEPGISRYVDKDYWRYLVESGTSFAAFADGRFLGCGGYSCPWKGVADVWVWDTPAVHEYPQGVHKIIRRALKHIEEDKGIWRISCEVREGNTRAEKWVRLLGFTPEGVMRKRGPDGSNFTLYARVRDKA